MIANDILKQNGIISHRTKDGFILKFNDKEVIRPDKPKDCYQLLIDEFGIVEPRLKNFK